MFARLRSRRKRPLGIAVALGVTVALAAPAAAVAPAAADEAAPGGGDAVPVQLLSITDLHGYFADNKQSVPGAHAGQPGQTVGGGAYLAAHLKQLREKAGLPAKNSILFANGDDYSGWPNEAALFWNESTIEFENYLGVQFSTIGNHELDRGLNFFRHMEDGTCPPKLLGGDLCFTDSTGKKFRGSDAKHYSANVFDGRGALISKPYHVEQVDDGRGGTIPVGFIHTTTETAIEQGLSYYAPNQLRVTSETAAINKYAARLQAQGVRSIVAVMHEGFTQRGGYDECTDPSGPIVDMNKEISPAVDAIVTGHWHATTNCSLPDPAGNPRPIVEAANHGRLISEINLQIDRGTGDVLRDRTVARNVPNTKDIAPDPGAQKIAKYWQDKVPARRAETIGQITGDLTRATKDPEGESSMGTVLADSFRWAGQRDAGQRDRGQRWPGHRAPAAIGIASPNQMLRDISHAPAGADDAPGEVKFSDVYLGIYNDRGGLGPGVFSSELTGREVRDLLQCQWRPDLSWSDGSVEADLTIDTGGALGLVFRQQDAKNYYLWQINGTASPGRVLLRPHAYVNGAWKVLPETDITSVIPAGELGDRHHVKVRAQGSTITTWVDGVRVDSRTDTQFARGGIGVRTSGGESGRVDNLAVRDLAGRTLYSSGFSAAPDPVFGATATLTDDGQLLARDNTTQFATGSCEARFPRLPETFQPLALSSNVTYKYQPRAPRESRIPYGQIWVDGKPLKPNATYRINTTSAEFTTTGTQEGFTPLAHTRNRHRTDFTTPDAVTGYLKATGPLAPPAPDRVRPLNGWPWGAPAAVRTLP